MAVTRKVSWTLAGRDEFELLLDNVNRLIDGLKDNYPMLEQKASDLAQAEILELGLEAKDLLELQTFLKNRAADKDVQFRKAVDAEVKKFASRSGNNGAHQNSMIMISCEIYTVDLGASSFSPTICDLLCRLLLTFSSYYLSYRTELRMSAQGSAGAWHVGCHQSRALQVHDLREASR